ALPFALPKGLQPGENRALAVNTHDGAVVYDVSYALVTVTDGAPVTSVNAAVAANGKCISCLTTAMAVQLIVTLNSAPSDIVTAQLKDALAGLDDLEGLAP